MVAFERKGLERMGEVNARLNAGGNGVAKENGMAQRMERRMEWPRWEVIT